MADVGRNQVERDHDEQGEMRKIGRGKAFDQRNRRKSDGENRERDVVVTVIVQLDRLIRPDRPG